MRTLRQAIRASAFGLLILSASPLAAAGQVAERTSSRALPFDVMMARATPGTWEM
jgi:hypothetical protein